MSRKSKTTVLVVEDDEDIMELISYNLNKEGYQVFRAITGEEALRCAEKETPNLILLDLMLPEIDGLEVCRRLKREEETSSLPIGGRLHYQTVQPARTGGPGARGTAAQ